MRFENDRIKQQQFFAIQNNEVHVITAQFHKKVKRTVLLFGKQKETVKGKKLTDDGLFPLKLQGREPAWKL